MFLLLPPQLIEVNDQSKRLPDDCQVWESFDKNIVEMAKQLKIKEVH
jgi:hypothetical protein